MSNLSYPKWIFLSAAKHFTDSISVITTFVEGAQERNLSGQSSWIEIRIDGPDIREVSKDTIVLESEINLLVATHIDPDAPAQHVINVGKATAAFTDFKIFKYGEDSEDDGSILDSFRLQPLEDIRDKIKVANMGQIDPAIKLLQTTVEGHYRLIVNE